MLKANIPKILAVVAEKSRKLIAGTFPQAAVQNAKWVAANPGRAATYGTAGVGLVLVAAPALVAAPRLGVSSIGSVVSPSLFATLQSAGAGGYGVATIYPVAQVMGGTIASAAGACVAWAKPKSRSKA
ncbi:hypothetical protein AOQ84DRAFT_359153 [Glonium stellatum]|uniref:Uncharacterized protein n=1 Tax=Glonium stellatum TaxID=574774 RepID=A0A8E2FBK1_9PEZI|nr:hypothetical protein AOQ84DRAFT_359153 [Glonium stellatum]